MDPMLDTDSDGFEDVEFSSQCAIQVGNGTFHTISRLALLVAVFKVLKFLHIPKTVQVYVHVAVATFTVAWFSSKKLETILIYNFFSVISLFCAMNKVSGYRVLAGNIALLIFIQNMCRYSKNDEYFLSIRGILMMHIMRLTTVAFNAEDTTAKNIKFEQFSIYVEYVYFPPFLIFGPYLTLEQFVKMRNKKWTRFEDEFGVIIRASLAIFNGVTLAIISLCHFEFFEPAFQFLEDALTAMSFRFSHYFVCFVTQAFVLLLGSDVTVASPFNVEFPRSTLQIVSNWNQPFHTFLRENIFRRRFFNSTAMNVLLTFAVSSLLHGRDYQMTFTLLSLGFIAYSETVFRKRLASRFSMCVAAKQCAVVRNRRTCRHRHTSFSVRVILINFFFLVLSMYHLVFTGMTFTDDFSATGYPFSHTWIIWGSHYYASFIISTVFLLFTWILSHF